MKAAPVIKRRIGIGLVAVCAMVLTAACATGQQAQTADTVATVDAAHGAVGDLRLHGVAIKAPPNGPSYASGAAAELQVSIVNTGQGTDTVQNISSPAVSGYQVFGTAAEASAAASASASTTPSSSTSESASTSASASGSASASTSGSASASGSTSASGSASASSSASTSSAAPAAPVSLAIPAGQAIELSANAADPVLLVRVNKQLFPGTSVAITFTFANAGSLTLEVPIQITAGGGSGGITVSAPTETGAA
ncbi:MAG: hypothetical protein ABI775_14085 [Pseudonocardiales bacterium]